MYSSHLFLLWPFCGTFSRLWISWRFGGELFTLIAPLYCFMMWSPMSLEPGQQWEHKSPSNHKNLMKLRLRPWRYFYLALSVLMDTWWKGCTIILNCLFTHSVVIAVSCALSWCQYAQTNTLLSTQRNNKIILFHNGLKKMLQKTCEEWKSPQAERHLCWLDTVEGCSTHGRPLAGAPLAAGAEAGGCLGGAGKVGTLRFVGHSSLGISAADVTGPLPFATRHWALEETQIKKLSSKHVLDFWRETQDLKHPGGSSTSVHIWPKMTFQKIDDDDGTSETRGSGIKGEGNSIRTNTRTYQVN